MFRHRGLRVLALAAVWLACGVALPVFSATAEEANLAAMEKRLYGTAFEKDATNTRLSRLERTVFGEVADTPPPASQRLARLEQVLQPAATATGHTALPKATTQPPTAPAYPPVATGPDATDYPRLTALEKRVLGQPATDKPLPERLATLERHIYGSPQPGSLAERTERLEVSVLGKRPATSGSAPAMPVPTWDESDEVAVASPYHGGPTTLQPGTWRVVNVTPRATPVTGSTPADALQQQDMQRALAEIERRVLNHTYPTESVDTRLARLETEIFNQPAPAGMASGDRLDRIIAVAAGGGNNSYSPKRESMLSTLRQALPFLIMLGAMLL